MRSIEKNREALGAFSFPSSSSSSSSSSSPFPSFPFLFPFAFLFFFCPSSSASSLSVGDALMRHCFLHFCIGRSKHCDGGINHYAFGSRDPSRRAHPAECRSLSDRRRNWMRPLDSAPAFRRPNQTDMNSRSNQIKILSNLPLGEWVPAVIYWTNSPNRNLGTTWNKIQINQ